MTTSLPSSRPPVPPVYEIFGVVKAEFSLIQQGLQMVEEHGIDLVIGVGGCSCMDLAKLIAFGHYHREDLWDYIHGVKSPVGENRLMLVEVPTYPSGGSEFGQGAVAHDSATGDHGTLYGVRADYAILSPQYSMTLNREMTTYTGLVTLSQLTASTLGDTNPISYGTGVAAAKAVFEALKTLQEDPKNEDARGIIMYGASVSTSGWLGLGKKSNYAYGIYDLEAIPEELFGAPYRQSLTLLLPRFLLALAEEHRETLETYFHDVFGINGSVEASVAHLIELFGSFGLDMYFHAGLSDETIRKAITEDTAGGLSFEAAFQLMKSCIK